MSKGKAQVNYLGREGLIMSQDAPDYSFLYEVSSVKDARWNIGDRVVTPDGKVFRYCKSAGACYPGRGNVFNNAIPATGIDYSVLAAAAALGATSIQMTNQGTCAIAEDELRGGQIVLKPASGSTDQELQFRGVIGNTADATTTGVVTIYLDAPLTEALTTSSYAFVMPSPYNAIKYESTSGTKSFAGIAAVEVSASGKYFWLQTYGLCWLAPQSRCGTTSYYRSVYWRHDGSVDIHTQIGTNVTDQLAGFIVDDNTAANGSTVIMLQVSI